ncbi:hypothetical protein F8M41_009793 [Gigaspora margarita]|uniref:F-box domain-containing protein n=1 Tax=Gigaspora margarita TaxID=4874 RepID=A0A8H3X3J2_GIGMA|nr:hypothetical protein F8M41_009793 [Gigaspora margarita]
MIFFPTECLLEILAFLQKDQGSLFSCLLINRHWCRITVPILWKEPCFKKGKLIRKFLQELNANERKLFFSGLNANELKLFFSRLNANERKLLLSEFNAQFKITIPSNTNPLFEYLTYIKKVSAFDLDDGVKDWLKYVRFNNSIVSSLIIIFLQKCKNLKELDLSGFILLDDKSKKKVLEVLFENNALTSVNLDFNTLDSEIRKKFTTSLHTTTSLSSLILLTNRLDFKSVKS